MENRDLVRIVTNSDLDAIVSAVLLRRVLPVGAVKFVPLEDVKTGKFKVSPVDVVVNMPYIEGCSLWFDHHASNREPDEFEGRYNPKAPSAARVIYNYYRKRDLATRFAGLEHLLKETDRVDNADFKRDDIINPSGAVLLSFLIDSHPLANHSVAENQLLIELLDKGGAKAALDHTIFNKRAERFLKNLERGKKIMAQHIRNENGLLIMDYRKLTEKQRQLCQNKFIPFILDPEAHSFLRIKELNENKVKLGLGYNMFWPEEECPAHFGNLLARFEGGGHRRAAGCAVKKSRLKVVIQQIKSALKK